MCLYARNRLPSVGVLVMLWTMGRKQAAIVSFDIIIGTDIRYPLEEIVFLSLEDLSSIETNR